MTTPRAVDDWFAGLLVGGDGPVVHGDVPPHAVSPLQGRLLELLARMAGARPSSARHARGLQRGLAAQALPPGGRLVTLEADPAYAEIARANLAGLPVDVLAGPALDTLQTLEGPFDLIFIDADKRSNPEYLRWALRLSRPGTVIVADNVVRDGAVLDGDDASARGVRAFAELVAAEPRLTATVVQTVGEKGWDGFLLALVGDA